jgi:hypothetical protein
MMLAKPEYLMLAGIALLLSLKARAISLPCFVLLEHKDNGKLLLAPLLLRAHGITME